MMIKSIQRAPCRNASPSVVWIGDNVYERVGCKGRHDEDVGDSVAPLRQTLGRKEEVCLVVESEEDCREGTDHVTDEHPPADLTGNYYPTAHLTNIKVNILEKFLVRFCKLEATAPLSSRLIREILIYNDG